MADVLGLLREYHLNKKPIKENDDEIIFGEFAWPKTAKTNYLVWGTGKEGTSKDYYTLDCIVFLLKNIELPHSQYVRCAANARVPVVRFPDRRELLAYLNGEATTAQNIDRTVPVDISLRRPLSKISNDSPNLRRLSEHLDRDGPLESKRARQLSYKPGDGVNSTGYGVNYRNTNLSSMEEDKLKLSPNESDNLTSSNNLDQTTNEGLLPKALSLDMIKSLRAKFLAKQQSTKLDTDGQGSPGVEDLIDSSLTPVAGFLSTGGMKFAPITKDPSYQGPNSQEIVTIDEQWLTRPFASDTTSRRGAILAADIDKVLVISSSERKWRSRTTILQSQGKTFYENIVLGILRNVMLKENSHLAPDHRTGMAGLNTNKNMLGPSDMTYPPGPLAVGLSYNKTPTGVHGSIFPPEHLNRHLNPASVGTQQMQYSRYDQERFMTGREDTAGFRIDTMGTYHGKALASMVSNNATASDVLPASGGTTNYNATPKPPSTPLAFGRELSTNRSEIPQNYAAGTPRDPRAFAIGTPLANTTPDPYRSMRPADLRIQPRSKPRASRVPIIIIPAAPTSLITMLNAQDLLQDLHFISNEEKRNQGCKRENEILIHRKKADGRTVPYRVIDQPNKLQPEEWNRVVAVFVQGPAWQFKGWPVGSDPAIIFSVLKGFHLKNSNMPLDPNVAKWNVHVINLDRRRHLDTINFQTVWDQLDKHISKYKSFLRF